MCEVARAAHHKFDHVCELDRAFFAALPSRFPCPQVRRETLGVRIAITGVGLICSIGHSVDTIGPRILRADRGIGPVSLFDVVGQRSMIAAEVVELEGHRADALASRSLQGPGDSGRSDVPWSRTDTLAWVAARDAMGQAGVRTRRRNLRAGVIVGGTTGGLFETEVMLAAMQVDPALRKPDRSMLAHPLSATVDRLDGALGPFVRSRTVCSACSSGAAVRS